MTTATQSLNLDPNAVSKRAYEIWEKLGRPEGVADQTWTEAERQLLGDAAKGTTKSDSSKTKSASAEPARVEPASPAPVEAAHQPSSEPPSSPNASSSDKKNGNNANTHRRTRS